jgi:hypothetical protein
MKIFKKNIPIILSIITIFFFSNCFKEEPKPKTTDDNASTNGEVELFTIHTNLSLDKDWVRGSEARVGNLFSDAYAWATNADIGFIAGGSIRNDYGTLVLEKGMVVEKEFDQALPHHTDEVYKINMQGYRLKQNLEAAATKLDEEKFSSKGDDADEDGPQHGNCYSKRVKGSGRFLQISAGLRVVINTKNAIQTVSGSSETNSLAVTSEGNRIVSIMVNGSIIYENSTGEINTGWSNSANSNACSFNGASFTNSAACDYFTAAINEWHAAGGDEHPAFNPDLKEINNDGSVEVLSWENKKGQNKDIIIKYVKYLNREFAKYKPKIEDRITFVE